MPQIYKNGIWRNGKAEPEQLREDLRKLPANFVTKDISDPDRIHALDPEHIREALIEEQLEIEPGDDPKETLETLTVAEVGDIVPFTGSKVNPQLEVDIIKMRVIWATVNNKEPDLDKGYLWFEENNINNYGFRKGNPPSDSERPKYLKGIDLDIDYFTWPQSIYNLLKKKGTILPDLTPEKLAWDKIRLEKVHEKQSKEREKA